MGDFTCSPVFSYIESSDFFFFNTDKLPIYLDYTEALKFGFAFLGLFWRWTGQRQLISVTITVPPLGVFWEEVLYKHKAVCKDGCIHLHNISWGGCVVNIVNTKLPVPQIEQGWLFSHCMKNDNFPLTFIKGNYPLDCFVHACLYVFVWLLLTNVTWRLAQKQRYITSLKVYICTLFPPCKSNREALILYTEVKRGRILHREHLLNKKMNTCHLWKAIP